MYWQSLDPVSGEQNSLFFDKHEAAREKIDVSVAIQVRDEQEGRITVLVAGHFKSIGVTDERLQTFLHRAFRAIPVVSAMMPRPMMPHKRLDSPFEADETESAFLMSHPLKQFSSPIHYRGMPSPAFSQNGRRDDASCSSASSSTDYGSSTGGRQRHVSGCGKGKGGSDTPPTRTTPAKRRKRGHNNF